MSEVKILRMITGEDVIGKVTKGDVIEVEKAFVIIPMRNQPGQPVQLMMTPYMPYSADTKITFDTDKVVTIVKPKDDILKLDIGLDCNVRAPYAVTTTLNNIN